MNGYLTLLSTVTSLSKTDTHPVRSTGACILEGYTLPAKSFKENT